MTSHTNPTLTTVPATGHQTEGVDASLSPVQANTAVTTDGFKKEDEITTGDGTGAVEGEDQQQPGQEQQTGKVESAEKAKQQQGGTASKLRSVFSRSKKGSDEVEGQGKAEDESAPKQKTDAE